MYDIFSTKEPKGDPDGKNVSTRPGAAIRKLAYEDPAAYWPGSRPHLSFDSSGAQKRPDPLDAGAIGGAQRPALARISLWGSQLGAQRPGGWMGDSEPWPPVGEGQDR